jgi:endonuclease-3 related protein
VRLLEILEENKGLLVKMGWIVGDATSYKWWGGLDTPDKIAISAFLVQMTKWETVKRVIERLEARGIHKVEDISSLSLEELDELIKAVNFHRTKAIRLMKFSVKVKEFGGLQKLLKVENRELLLSMEGVGEETADSLLLFAGNNLVLPQTEYLRRVLGRVLGKEMGKRKAKEEAEKFLPRDLYYYKLFHAGMVSVGKAFCRLTSPKCERCVFKDLCKYSNL